MPRPPVNSRTSPEKPLLGKRRWANLLVASRWAKELPLAKGHQCLLVKLLRVRELRCLLVKLRLVSLLPNQQLRNHRQLSKQRLRNFSKRASNSPKHNRLRAKVLQKSRAKLK